MFRNFHVHAEPRWQAHGIMLHFYERQQNGDISLLSGLQFTTVKEGESVEPQESIVMPLETAQELIDSLWQCGLRPSEGSGSAGSLKATENHLKDLQTLSWRLLSIVERTPSNTASTASILFGQLPKASTPPNKRMKPTLSSERG